MSHELNRKTTNPFSEQGVSKYPPITPLVGQPVVYQRLEELLETMREQVGSCFRVVYGDWGIGKTRLAHELVAEACNLSQGWLVKIPGNTTEHKRLLKPLSEEGILPIFTTFTDILRAPEEGIDLHSALPKAVCVALISLAQASGRDFQVRMANDLQNSLRQFNPDFDFDELAFIARDPNKALLERANLAFQYLQTHTGKDSKPTVQKLLVVIDEVETAGEFTPANTAEERRIQEFPVEAFDIKKLFSAVKLEAGQATLPHISFLLLCSPGVKRVAPTEALERRLKDADLKKATGDDLKILLESIHHDGYFTDYPGELPQAAFLAADRNYGWLSYIMHPVHRLIQDGKLSGPDYAILQEVSGRIGKIFKPQLIDGLNVDSVFKDYLRRIVYHQLPTTLQKLGIPSTSRQDLLNYIDPYGLRVVGEVIVIRIDGDTLIRELRGTGKYQEENQESTRLIGEGSDSFEPQELLARFSTYEGIEAGTLLIFDGASEFASQVRFLIPEELSENTISTLQGIFKKYKIPGTDTMVAPTVAFLLKFNERWASVGSRAWLSDQTWEKLDRQIKELNNTQVRQRICLGTAKVLNDSIQHYMNSREMSTTRISWKVGENDELHLTKEGKVSVIYASDTSSLIQDLTELNKNPVPVLVIFPNEERLKDWRAELALTRRQELDRLVIARVISAGSREHEFLLRYSYRDEDDGFQASEVRDRGKDLRREYEREWNNARKGWLEQLDKNGYLLKPLIPQGGKYIELRNAYGLLVTGKTRDQITNEENGPAMRQAIDNAIMYVTIGSLRIFRDQSASLYFPNIFSRILDLLSNPMRVDQLADRFFYQRISQGGFNSPKAANLVVEQVLGLLEELGLVEKVDGQYISIDEQRLGVLLTKAINQLGNFGDSPSNYIKDVRELTAPFKLLAFKLQIIEEQLKLLANELVNDQEKLPSLDLNAQKQIPTSQEAFQNVAGIVKKIRASVNKVFREPIVVQQQIDPNTITQNLQQIAQDNNYISFSVEYRVQFLKDLQHLVEAECQSRQKEIEYLRSRIQGVLSKNSDGSAFPTQAIEIILNFAKRDIENQDVNLPNTLLTSELNAGLKTYMMAGEIDKAFRRLYQYRIWLSKEQPDSYYNRFETAYNQWQEAIPQANSLSSNLSLVLAYFEGDPDRQRWLSTDLETHCLIALAHVKGFNDDFQVDYPSPKLEDLEEEVKANIDQLVDLTNKVNQASHDGHIEIGQAINQTTFAALQKLAEHLGQPPRVSDRIVWNEKRHIDQHTKVNDLNTQCKARGSELLEDENLFGKYVLIYQEHIAGKTTQDILQMCDEEILWSLHRKGAISLERILTLEL
jgi:hypothetical protein